MFLSDIKTETGPWASVIVCSMGQYRLLKEGKLLLDYETQEIVTYGDAKRRLKDFYTIFGKGEEVDSLSRDELLLHLSHEEIAMSLEEFLGGEDPDFLEEFTFPGVGACVIFGFIGEEDE